MKIYKDLLQGSDEWHEARRGILTASTMKSIITEAKLQPVKKGSKFAFELLTQRITGEVEADYISDDMLRGHDDEITAREIYREKFCAVEEVGFITEEIEGVKIGYSPDGLVGENGAIEIKSRRKKYQIETIVSGEVPSEYMLQIQTGLMVSGREWIDFVSYSSGLPLFVKRVFPDENMISKIKIAIVEFEKELSEYEKAYSENSKHMILTEPKTYDFEVDYE